MQRRSTDKLGEFLSELESAIADRNLISESVSSVKVGWHVEHSLLVLSAVVENLKSSEPKEFTKKFSFLKSYIFTMGKIPRGKGRSPKSVKPKGEATKEELEKHVSTARTNISELSKLDTDKFFKHPLFGDLRLRDSIRFLELHTVHHLKIIRAIQKSQ